MSMPNWFHHTKRISKHVSKKTGHILFPYVWHYFTDTYKDKTHHLIADSILSIVIMALLVTHMALGLQAYFLLTPPALLVRLEMPETVFSGNTVMGTLSYQSVSKTLTDVKLRVYAPTGFQAQQSLIVQANTVSTNTPSTLPITGKLIGTMKQQYRFVVVYQFKYFGQMHYGFLTQRIRVDGSSLEVVANVPDKTLAYEPIQWTIDYTNSTDTVRPRSCLQFNLPSQFFIESSTLPITSRQRIRLPKLQPRQSGTITVTGNFKRAIGEGSQLLSVTALDRCGRGDFIQAHLTNPITVLTPRFTLATSGASVVNVGDVVRYTNTYTNTGDAPLTHVELTTTLDHFTGHYNSIVPTGGSISGNIIRWVDSNIAPGETHSRSFTVYTNSAQREKNAEWSYRTSAQARIADLGISTYVPDVSLSAKFNSTLNFSSIYRHSKSTGEQLGYGPYPLEADNITALLVLWQIKDFTNDLSSVTITTTLPGQVEWTGLSSVTSGSNISYNSNTRTITWHTNRVPSFSNAQGASFEIRVRPNSAQIGQRINLTNETKFSARDSFTNTVITRQLGALRVEDAVADVQ